jgi:spore coat protein U-like protein
MTTASGLALAAVMVLASSPDAHAQTATANLNVSANVAEKCTISTLSVNFGAYDPIQNHLVIALDQTGSVIIRCTQGATASIGLDLGDNASGGVRRMADGANLLTYELYIDSGRTQVWGNAPRTFTVYGRIPPAQDVPPGNYADIVEATVNF